MEYNKINTENTELGKEYLLLSTDFGTIEGDLVRSRVGSSGILHKNTGVMRAVSFDGGAALYFDNPGGQNCAAQFLNFGRIPFGTDDFSIQFWMKTKRGGCNGWCGAAEGIAPDTFVDHSALTDEQKNAEA